MVVLVLSLTPKGFSAQENTCTLAPGSIDWKRQINTRNYFEQHLEPAMTKALLNVGWLERHKLSHFLFATKLGYTDILSMVMNGDQRRGVVFGISQWVSSIFKSNYGNELKKSPEFCRVLKSTLSDLLEKTGLPVIPEQMSLDFLFNSKPGMDMHVKFNGFIKNLGASVLGERNDLHYAELYAFFKSLLVVHRMDLSESLMIRNKLSQTPLFDEVSWQNVNRIIRRAMFPKLFTEVENIMTMGEDYFIPVYSYRPIQLVLNREKPFISRFWVRVQKNDLVFTHMASGEKFYLSKEEKLHIDAEPPVMDKFSHFLITKGLLNPGQNIYLDYINHEPEEERSVLLIRPNSKHVKVKYWRAPEDKYYSKNISNKFRSLYHLWKGSISYAADIDERVEKTAKLHPGLSKIEISILVSFFRANPYLSFMQVMHLAVRDDTPVQTIFKFDAKSTVDFNSLTGARLGENLLGRIIHWAA